MDRKTFKSYKRNLYKIFSTRKERARDTKSNINTCVESDLANVIKRVGNISILGHTVLNTLSKMVEEGHVTGVDFLYESQGH